MVSAAVHAAATALREQLVALAVADDELAAARRRPGGGRGRRRAHALRGRPDAGETYGELLAAQPARPTPRRSAAGPRRRWTPRTGCSRSARSSPRWPSTPSSGLVRVRRMVGVFAPGRVLNPQARPQPADGRDALGTGPGPARGQPDGPAARALGRDAPRRIPGAGQRRRARRDDRVRRGHTTRWSTRSGSRASARSARSARPPRSPTRSSTRPAAGSASCRSPPSWSWTRVIVARSRPPSPRPGPARPAPVTVRAARPGGAEHQRAARAAVAAGAGGPAGALGPAPGLGALGLLLVLPVAVLLAFGAAAPSRSRSCSPRW